MSLFISVPSAQYFQMRHWSNIMNVSIPWSVPAEELSLRELFGSRFCTVCG
jgi:hypothetical protein